MSLTEDVYSLVQCHQCTMQDGVFVCVCVCVYVCVFLTRSAFFLSYSCPITNRGDELCTLYYPSTCISVLGSLQVPYLLTSRYHNNLLHSLPIRVIRKVRKTQHQNPEFQHFIPRFDKNFLTLQTSLKERGDRG
jgi:hypothetical protein